MDLNLYLLGGTQWYQGEVGDNSLHTISLVLDRFVLDNSILDIPIPFIGKNQFIRPSTETNDQHLDKCLFWYKDTILKSMRCTWSIDDKRHGELNLRQFQLSAADLNVVKRSDISMDLELLVSKEASTLCVISPIIRVPSTDASRQFRLSGKLSSASQSADDFTSGLILLGPWSVMLEQRVEDSHFSHDFSFFANLSGVYIICWTLLDLTANREYSVEQIVDVLEA